MADEVTSSSDSCSCSSPISSIVSLGNALQFNTIKLSTPTDYPLWRTQITLFLKAQNLIRFVDGTYPCPPLTHPNYAQWIHQDGLIMMLLIASLSQDVFRKVIGLKTSHDIWVTLEKALIDGQVQSGNSFTQMDPSLYESAQSGKLDIFIQNKDQLHAQRTPNNDTLLHVLAQFHDSAECVGVILDGLSSSVMQSMLLSKNSKGETVLHIAARNGHCKIVRALIECARTLDKEEEIESRANIAEEMMRAMDQNGDTALHVAVRNKHAEVVRLFAEEDPKFSHPLNNMGQTPLYLAAEITSRHQPIVEIILKKCKSPPYKGPGNRTALHAAVVNDCQDCTAQLLKHKRDLTKEVDEFGWSPLHYAARLNHKSRAIELLEVDRSAAYITATEDDNRTLLHVAACQGNEEVMQELLNYCPDCWEMVTSKGQNILHLAVDNEKKKATRFILRNSWAANLINEKDIEGNTPLHLYATSYNFDMKSLVEHFGADTNAFNGQNLTPLYIVENLQRLSLREKDIKAQLQNKSGTLGYRNLIKSDRDSYQTRKEVLAELGKELPEGVKKQFETVLLIATLIATITFAAGFTVPGGYDGNEGPDQGLPFLTRKAAFKAFIVSDAISLASSVLAVFLYLVASLYTKKGESLRHYDFALSLVIFSTVAMTVAFTTGLYTVLAPSSLPLAIAVCFLASYAILIVFWLLYRFIKDLWIEMAKLLMR